MTVPLLLLQLRTVRYFVVMSPERLMQLAEEL
jgi:hypothetical protein